MSGFSYCVLGYNIATPPSREKGKTGSRVRLPVRKSAFSVKQVLGEVNQPREHPEAVIAQNATPNDHPYSSLIFI